jgi:hypothetical protein
VLSKKTQTNRQAQAREQVMSRTTQGDLTTAMNYIRIAAVKAGVAEAAYWQLEKGSKTYGRAYRIWLMKDGETGHYTPVVNDFLGMTASEALHTLQAMRSAFLAVVDSAR